MARYTSSYIATVSLKQLPPLLNQILESCEFEVIYQAIDYIMAREIPGKVTFSKLLYCNFYLTLPIFRMVTFMSCDTKYMVDSVSGVCDELTRI